MKRIIEEFPSLPVPMADFILYHEASIRQAVKEARDSVSILGASNLDGRSGKGRKTDRTGAAAVRMADALPCVVLDGGEKVAQPEMWLFCLDAVREKASTLENTRLIYDAFAEYSKAPCLVLAYTPPEQKIACRSWLRYHLLSEAREKGLVSFSDNDICEAVQAAEDQELERFAAWWDGYEAEGSPRLK